MAIYKILLNKLLFFLLSQIDLYDKDMKNITNRIKYRNLCRKLKQNVMDYNH